MLGKKGIASSQSIVEIHQHGSPVFVYGKMTPQKAVKAVKRHILNGTSALDWLIGLTEGGA